MNPTYKYLDKNILDTLNNIRLFDLSNAGGSSTVLEYNLLNILSKKASQSDYSDFIYTAIYIIKFINLFFIFVKLDSNIF